MQTSEIDFLTQHITENPNSPIFARVADMYLSQKKIEEAITLCENGTQLYQNYSSGFIVLGKAYLLNRQYSKARVAFQQAIHLTPFNKFARKLLANVPRKEDGEAAENIEGIITSFTDSVIEQVVEKETEKITISEEPEIFVDESKEKLPQQEQSEQKFPTLEEYVAQQMNLLQNTETISFEEYLSTPSQKIQNDEIGTIAERLQNVERIKPQENSSHDSLVQEESSNSNIITPTLAEIYASQGEYNAAIQAYELLSISDAANAEKYQKRIQELQVKMMEGF